MRAINPEMVTVARESRGLSQSELARNLSITQGGLSKIESGLKSPSHDLVEKLSRILDYPPEFFCSQEPVLGLGVGTLYHRKRKALGSRALASIHAQVNIRRIHVSRLLKAMEFPEGKIRRFDLDQIAGGPGEVARAVRASWLLPNGPVQNITRIIEDAGGIVVRCDFGSTLIDAISQWPPDMPPLFFVNENVPGDRLRYSLAHELGHIVMHEVYSEDMEAEANHFAAEFLLPAAEVGPFLSQLTLPKLATLKCYWKVSMAAILKRAADLKRITARQARHLWMQMGYLGYRRKEPAELEIATEEPSSLAELLDTYKQDLGYSIGDLSALLTMYEHDLRAYYFGQRGRLKLVNSFGPIHGKMIRV